MKPHARSGILMLVLVSAVLAACCGSGVVALAEPAPPSEGPVIVPGQFLRQWDPVTIFFPGPKGPRLGGPEDHPERFVHFSPAHPGAFSWIDERTLQFKPSEPWPSLARFEWLVEGMRRTLVTLVAPPIGTIPANHSRDLPPVGEITLTFSEPIPAESLAGMIDLELRPLPGVGSRESQRRGGDDFTIKVLDRKERSSPAVYVLSLKEVIPPGIRTVVHLRLSLDEGPAESSYEFWFATAEPFRVLTAGSRRSRYPISPAGSRYSREQAIDGGGGPRSLLVEFSAAPRALGTIQSRNLLRFTPAVENLSFELQGRTLEVSGDFEAETLYRVEIVPEKIEDVSGRLLDLDEPAELYIHFPARPDYLRLATGQGIVERLGPQTIPVEGRGETQVDLRIYPVAPDDRNFWPFPDGPLVVDESKRPPGPGEEPPPFQDADRPIGQGELEARLSNLGSPPVSVMVDLPLHRGGSAARFGLNLEEYLGRLGPAGSPGTYLIGLRDLKSMGNRSWMRVQVTDLCLSVVEAPDEVVFEVTSLSTARPVAGATVRVEGSEAVGSQRPGWVTFGAVTTDRDGRAHWMPPGPSDRRRQVMRIRVTSGQDTLVLDPLRAPDRFADNQWSQARDRWLQWTLGPIDQRRPSPQILCHLFTERPVYRPEEEVHIKGYLRRAVDGRLEPISPKGSLWIEGPGGQVWKYPVEVTTRGTFYHRFFESDLPTGEFRAHFLDPAGACSCGEVTFKKEAYRIPRFEVNLHGPDRTPLDRDFEVTLSARYYAGGKVSGQPVSWRVTQFPQVWTPAQQEGFHYSSDGRFSRTERFESSPRLEKEDRTDENGSCSITLNPAVEPTSQPRLYLVEATVTGADDQTVTATKRVVAVPPFVIGLKAPRYIEHAESIEPEFEVVGPDGQLIQGQPVTMRLFRREWHSHLRASDFSDGTARYITDVVDVKVEERSLVSASEPARVVFPIDRSGVYIVEVEGHDRLERAQVVRVDLYAGGAEPVTWEKPTANIFSVSTDQESYDPGSTAALVLKSPFQRARALAIVERPDGNDYSWLDVEGGAATFKLPVKGYFTPRLPVHFVLMRGRLPDTAPQSHGDTDLGKPSTLASTVWVGVNPVSLRSKLELQYPETARPGQTIDVTVTLTDPQNRPIGGEVTLWLVDQAVLALGREQRLDPVPDFLRDVRSELSLRDTRNQSFGRLPYEDLPGGGVAEKEAPTLLDRVTVRRDFRPVPYYNPSVMVGPDGRTTVQVRLPDNLTNFKIRAKSVSGAERFGYATGHLEVRLPVIVQPALPRFVRPGDRFDAVAIARVVEGSGGPGRLEMAGEGFTLESSGRSDLVLSEEQPVRAGFRISIPTPPLGEDGAWSYDRVKLRAAVERLGDQAADAFEVELPIQVDREPVKSELLSEVVPGRALEVPAVSEEVRPGTLQRSILLSTQPALVKLDAGLSFLLDYPYGCTEQQVSRARAFLALARLRSLLHHSESDQKLRTGVEEVLRWIPRVIDDNGLVAYWPGSTGYVSLTSWVLEFLTEAREAGFTVDAALTDRIVQSLERSLRSDYSHFIDGESYLERTLALAALARAGRSNEAYASELARRAQFLGLEGQAEVLLAFARAGGDRPEMVEALIRHLWDGVIIRLHQGREIYGGLQWKRASVNGLILPSETRVLSELTRALATYDRQDRRFPVLVDAIVTLGENDGWGSTNANAAAMLALSELLDTQPEGSPKQTVRLQIGGEPEELELGGDRPVVYRTTSASGAARIDAISGESGATLVARAETRYVPAADGSQAGAESSGFVVSRELLRVLGDDRPMERTPLEGPGQTLEFPVGQVLEEHVQIVNPAERHYVAVVVPIAAGVEVLNPHLATAPPEAAPSGRTTLAPTYVTFLDDRVAFYYNSLPEGTFDFFFRTRTTISGEFIQPPARAAMMYQGAVRGNSPGARIRVARAPE